MSAKRNPFNENVNHLMEKIFLGKEGSSAPQKKYKNENILKAEDGILHDTKPRKKNMGAGENFLTDAQTSEKMSRSSDMSKFSLKDIRHTTEKIRETTKQMQQMTLQMWEETVRREAGGESKVYKEECIPPREAVPKQDKGVSRQPQNKETARWNIVAPGVYKKPDVSWKKTVPQYRVEEIMDDTVPERIRDCKALARSPQGYRMTKEELFFHQAQMMEDYQDDCFYPGDFAWYFPTYQAMNIAQLRGYFTWRTQVRQGNIVRAPLSFAFVYVYELLHQIGAKTPEEGFLLLKTFWENYREYDAQLDPYMQNWLCDYVVYYNLDRELLLNLQDMAFDDAMLVFLHPEESGEEKYFTAICALSKYNMEGSKFYKEYPQDVRSVTCGVFRALSTYYEKHGKKTFSEKYFGTRATCSYQMFVSAVFYDYKRYVEYEYILNPLHRYHCVNGRWSCEKYLGNRTKNKELGFILRAIDARMRERYEYHAPLKPEGMTKLVMNIIEKEITRLLDEKKKNAAPMIEIDVTKLSGIRRAADLTRDRLIVEGSEEDTGVEFAYGNEGNLGINIGCLDVMETMPKEDTTQKETVYTSDSLLSEAECTLLHGLLYGTPYQAFLCERRLMLSVVVDAVNEKLFDCFGDTVIVFDGDTPQVLADYEEEVAAILKEEERKF